MLPEVQSARRAADQRVCRLVLICSPKGGQGKSMLARNLLVAAGMNSVRAVGLDFDQQGSLQKWAVRRTNTVRQIETIIPVEVRTAKLNDVESTLDEVSSYQAALIDTPPGIEGSYASILRLCELADFVLVPTGSTIDDLDAVIPWMRTLSQMGARTAFCLNRVYSRTSSYKQARTKLLKIGPLCPVEVPQLEDMHSSANAGLTPLDVPNSKGADAVEGLWEFVRREARL